MWTTYFWIVFSGLFSNTNCSQSGDNLNDMLTADQRRFIDDTEDVHKMIGASREFRQKFQFFVRLNQTFVNLSNEVAMEALDAIKEQAFRINIENKQHAMSRFYPKIISPSESITWFIAAGNGYFSFKLFSQAAIEIKMIR